MQSFCIEYECGTNIASHTLLHRTEFVRDNLLTRTLSGNKYSILTDADYEVAKEILKRKFIIGLYSNLQESLERFQLFFGWELNAQAAACQANELQRESTAHYNRFATDAGSKDIHPGLTDDGAALEIIMSKNKIDLMLFDYAKFLFDYQGRSLFELGPTVEG